MLGLGPYLVPSTINATRVDHSRCSISCSTGSIVAKVYSIHTVLIHLEVDGVRKVGKVPSDGHKLASPIRFVRHRLANKYELRLAAGWPLVVKGIEDCRLMAVGARREDLSGRRGRDGRTEGSKGFDHALHEVNTHLLYVISEIDEHHRPVRSGKKNNLRVPPRPVIINKIPLLPSCAVMKKQKKLLVLHRPPSG